jgi:hypothetical protein
MRKAGPTGACLLILGLITLGEFRLLDRLLLSDPAEYGFVRQNIAGILAGTPVWKAFQHRVLGPALVVALDRLTGDGLESLRLYGRLMVAGANLLLFAIVRWRGGRPLEGLLAVAGFALVRLLLTFKLEFPWDGVDILLFLAFGYGASQGASILRLGPLLLAGTFNHETALYMPLWYLLAWLDQPRVSPRARLQTLVAPLVAIALMAGVIAGVREHFYRGPPHLPGQVFEPITPIISNPFHLVHNLGQFLADDWTAVGRAFVSAGLLSLLVVLVRNVAQGRRVRASAWSLAVIASIFLFGYVNETRLYFPLAAFWAAYGWPVSSVPRQDC